MKMIIAAIMLIFSIPFVAHAEHIEITITQYDTESVAVEHDLIRMAEYLPESGAVFGAFVEFEGELALIYPAPALGMMCLESSYRVRCFFPGTPVEKELRRLWGSIGDYIKSPDGL